jgi:hypothetical protein
MSIVSLSFLAWTTPKHSRFPNGEPMSSTVITRVGKDVAYPCANPSPLVVVVARLLSACRKSGDVTSFQDYRFRSLFLRGETSDLGPRFISKFFQPKPRLC